jgi:hypothetical protein
MVVIRISEETAKELQKTGLSYEKAIVNLLSKQQVNTNVNNSVNIGKPEGLNLSGYKHLSNGQEEEIKGIVNRAIMTATYRIKEDIAEDVKKAQEALYLRIRGASVAEKVTETERKEEVE